MINKENKMTEIHKRLLAKVFDGIDTPDGKIHFEISNEGKYPGIKITVDGECASVVEYDSITKKVYVRAYSKEFEEPEYSAQYSDPNPEEE